MLFISLKGDAMERHKLHASKSDQPNTRQMKTPSGCVKIYPNGKREIIRSSTPDVHDIQKSLKW